MTLPRGYLSPSQITTYTLCPRQYWWKYVVGEVAPPRGATVQGTAAHSAAQAALVHRMANGEDLAPDAVRDAAATAFDLAIPEADLAVDEEPGALKDEAVALAGLWAREVAPLLSPVAVEERFSVDIDGIEVVGYLDVRELDGVADLKTVGRAPAEDAAEKSMQFALYAIAAEAAHGMFAPEVRADYLVRGRQPRHVRQTVTLPEGRLAATEETVRDVAAAIESGLFPRNPSAFICSAKACPFHHRCWSGARSATVVVNGVAH